MTLESDLKESRELEMRVYLDSMAAMYENALLQNGEIYDIAAELTANFTCITPEAILADSRIIKVFRYAIAPSISQMKFGQFFGLSSIDKYENSKLSPRTLRHDGLIEMAPAIAQFMNERLDRGRFHWADDKLTKRERALAADFAKKWTCSIAADQNAQTRYRNWRKEQQELAIETAIVGLGYTKSEFSGIIANRTDINIGEYTKEIRVQGRTKQKADIAIRSKSTKKLILIEAKAVGVEIDSTKRIKECCDKSSDWRASSTLDDPVVVTVIAGFFSSVGIQNLNASGIRVVWEHRLADLKGVL